MKKYNLILTLVCGAALFASCDKLNETPTFSKSESFAAITISSLSVDEDKGQIVIPVQVASIDPVNTSVSYRLVDGTAVAGVNYEDTNESAVLTFADGSREENIVINIINHPGEFTGDLGFSIELLSATGLKLSLENTCKVTICDIDHPLAAILGSYTVNCTEHWAGETSYTMNIVKDDKDLNTVWCDGICPMVAGASAYSPVYATVSQDEDGNYTLSFPCGQVMYKNFQSDGDLILCETYYQSGYYVDDETTIVFTQVGDVVFESHNGMGVVTNSYVWQGGFVYGDKTGDYKTTWTKN